jgi:hypothetical protein
MSDREDEQLRQRLQDENLARASRVPPRARFVDAPLPILSPEEIARRAHAEIRGEAMRQAAESRARMAAERDSNPLPLTRAPRDVPKPEPLWLRDRVPTHGAYADELARRRGRVGLVLGGFAAVVLGAFVAWLVRS